MNPLKTYKLNGSYFLDPRWLNRFRGGHQDGEVTADGKVLVHGQTLTFSDQGGTLPTGAKVKVWVAHDFVCAEAAEIVTRDQALKEEGERKAADAKMACERREAEDREFNARLVVPVKWQPGIKDVLSGLSEHSDGSGRNRATVIHILLLEDLNEGRLRRSAGDFLCSSNPEMNGKGWSGQRYEPDGRITCARCLALAKTWQPKTS
jgi:hypothetical protein